LGLALIIIGVGLSVGESTAQTIGNLFKLMGGMDTIQKKALKQPASVHRE